MLVRLFLHPLTLLRNAFSSVRRGAFWWKLPFLFFLLFLNEGSVAKEKEGYLEKPKRVEEEKDSFTRGETYIVSPSHAREDIGKIIKKANQQSIPIALKNSHLALSYFSSLEDCLILDLSHLVRMGLREGREGQQVLKVEPGVTWKQIIEFLNPKGLSIPIMPSEYGLTMSESVAGNFHGWQAKKPLIGGIEGLHLLNSKGEEQYCSRTQNSDLFKASIGGYGAVGIVLDVELGLTQNQVFELRAGEIEPKDFLSLLDRILPQNEDSMFFATFLLDKDHFLEKIFYRTYVETGEKTPHPWLPDIEWTDQFLDFLFGFRTGTTVDHEYKSLPRNVLLYHSLSDYWARKGHAKAVTQEFFVPLRNFSRFVDALQAYREELYEALLSVSIRYVQEDQESLLKYAHEDSVCFVLLFRDEKSEGKVRSLVSLITNEVVNSEGGTFYLPDSVYQTSQQVKKGYGAELESFKTIKEQVDPHNRFYLPDLNLN